MNIFYDDHKAILQRLLVNKVDFLLVGGYAVIYHGYDRLTSDLDIWLKPDNGNKMLLIKSLNELHYESEGLKTIESWNFTQPQLFHIGKKPDLTDFMTKISGVDYAKARAQAISAKIDGLDLLFIHLNNLIENKLSTGRFKDLSDVEHLRKIHLFKNKHD